MSTKGRQTGYASALAFTLHRIKQPTVLLDPQLNIIYFNRAALRNFGRDKRRWRDTGVPIGDDVFETLRKRRQDALREAGDLKAVADDRQSLYEDFEEPEDVEEASKAFIERDGKAYLVEAFRGNDEYADQTLFSVIFWHVDIISDYKSLFDNLPVMVAQETKTDRYANVDFQRFTGVKGAESDFMSVVHPEDRAEVEETLFNHSSAIDAPSDSQVLNGWQRSERAHRMRTAAGEYRWVKTSAVTDGNRRTFLSVDSHDLWTQAVSLRKKGARLEEENKRLALDESQAVELSASKSAALATTAHEQRTYATGVIGMVDLLLDSGLDAEQVQYARAIRSSADGLLKIISDVLDISRLEAGKLLIESKPFDLVRTIRDLQTLFQFMTSSKGLELKVDIQLGEYNVLGDAGRVRQILINLLTNSIKFTPKGSVSLAIRQEEETDKTIKIRFTISDTGAGMTKGTMDSLFSRFAQGEAGRRFGGTGLGLSICKQLLDLMHGEIGCESEEGAGTTFWFWLVFDKTTHAATRAAMSSESGSNGNGNSISHRDDSDVDDASQASLQEIRQSAFKALEQTRLSKTGHMSSRLKVGEKAARVRSPTKSNASGASDTAQVEASDSDEYDHSQDWPPQIELNQAFANPPRGDSDDPSVTTGRKGSRPSTVSDPQRVGSSHSSSQRKSALGSRSVKSLTDSLGSNDPVGELTGPPATMSSVSASGGALGGKSRGSSSVSSMLTMESKDKHVLLVEDNAIVSKITTNMLRKLGYTSTAVSDGQSAVDLVAASSSFDLILMDKEMPPGIDGLEATRRIRQSPNENMRGIPIIALTASAMTGEREKCIAATMDDFLTKPVEPRKLERKLHRWLFR